MVEVYYMVRSQNAGGWTREQSWATLREAAECAAFRASIGHTGVTIRSVDLRG